MQSVKIFFIFMYLGYVKCWLWSYPLQDKLVGHFPPNNVACVTMILNTTIFFRFDRNETRLFITFRKKSKNKIKNYDIQNCSDGWCQ